MDDQSAYETNERLVAAILYAEWFRKYGLPNSATNKDDFIKEYADMLKRVKGAI